MNAETYPIVHIEDPNQHRIRAEGFESLRLTYCDRWFPMRSPLLAAWAPLGGVMCSQCLLEQLKRLRALCQHN